MARIVQQGVITTSGVSFENEPIVRSDGSGEIMQWQPSDGGADGIYIVEGGSEGDPARLGIGVAAPGSPLAIKDIVDNSNESGIRLLRSANSDCAFINMRGGAFNINTRNNAANAGLPFKVKMHGTDVFDIDTSGNVNVTSGYLKIGPTDATADFRLYRNDSSILDTNAIGDIKFGGADASNDAAARIRAIADGGDWTATSSPTALEFATCPVGSETLATRLTIDSSGNASIKASGADQKRTLNVHGTNGSSELYTFAIEADGENAKTNFKVGSGGGAASTKLTIDSTGNVGIGTPTPTVGNLQIRDDSVSILALTRTTASTSSDIGMVRFGNTNVDSNLANIVAYHDGANDAAKLVFQTQATGGSTADRLTISSTGKTNIGDVEINGTYNLQLTDSANGGVSQCVMRQSRGTTASPLDSHANGDGNYISSQIYNSSAYSTISQIGMVTGSAFNTGRMLFRTTQAGGSLTTRLQIGESGAISIPSVSGTHVALTVKGGNDLVDNIAFNVTNQSGTGVANIRNNGALYASAITSTGTLTVGSLDIGHGLGGDVNSVAIGNDALDATTAHCLHNTAVGNNALSGLNSSASSSDAGDFNTSVGSNSSSSMTTGHSNTAVGRNALGTDDGVRNVSIGMGSLDANCADDNAALGYNALAAYTGSNAVAIGSGAADAATTAAYLTAIGDNAGGALVDQPHNTFVGYRSGLNTLGQSNTFVGAGSGYYTDDVDHCIAIGHNALLGVDGGTTDGDYNIAIGSYALDAATTASNNVAIGYEAATSMDEQSDNVAVGYKALKTETSSGGSVAIGSEALETQNVSNSNNVAVGRLAGHLLTTGTDGVYIGHSAAGGATLTGNDNTVVGKSAGYDLTSGYRNVLLGSGAGANVTDNFSNIAIGHNAFLTANTGENYNVAIGGNALYSETSGADYCVAVGYNAMIGQNANVVNTSVGSSALFHNKSGGNSVALGMSAGYANVDSYNTWIGHQAGAHTGHAAANTTLGYRTYFSSTFTNGTCDLNGSTTVTCDSNTDIQVGQSVTGSGIPYGAYVTAVNDSTAVTSFTLSIAATTTANNQTLSFYRGTGDSNTCIGYQAGEDITWGYENVLIGRDAGKNFTTNSQNVAIGAYTLDAANGGENFNVAIGYGALSVETSGADYCVAIGHHALVYQNANVKNTAIGGLAGDAIVSGTGNTAVGYVACSAAAGNYNTAIGHVAYAKGTGASNVVIGASAGSSTDNTGTAMSGNDNVIIGHAAGFDLTDGPGNVLIGRSAGANMTTGDNNVVIGYQAADAMVGDSDYNIAIGSDALGSEASGADSCIAIGTNALLSQNDASAVNLAIGKSAGDAITSGKQHVLIGHEAGSALGSNDDCTALGFRALLAATGNSNTAIGAGAMTNACSGSNNVAIGPSALGQAANSESHNVAIGKSALQKLAHNDGDYNIAIGSDAGRYYEDTATATPGSATPDGDNTAGANSIFIGYDTRASESDRSNEIVIGHTAVGNGSNTITLGNDDTSSIHCADTSISALSDRRIKRDITDNNVGLDFVEKLATVNYKRLNPADWPEEIRSHRYRVEEHKELVTPAVEAAEAVYKDVVVVEARAAVEEVTETIEHPAKEAVYEDVIIPAVEELSEERVTQTAQEEITEERVVQEAREEVRGERHKHTETEVTETVTREEIVEIDGKWVKREVSEEVTRTERTPVYEECDLYNEDGTQCMCCVVEAVEAKEAVTREIPAVTEERQVVDENGDGVVDEEGNAVMETVELEPARTEIVEPAVEAVEAVHEPMKHKVPVMEEYVVQAAQEEVRETLVVQEAREEVREMVVVRKAEPERTERRLVSPAVPARTEVRIITPAEPAVEEVKERRLVSPAVEAQEAVYKTVTVPADERPDDDDTIRLGLVAQDVQTAMTEAGVEFDLVTTGANGKLAVKYSNLVIPLLKAVQELSAEVKALKG